MRRGPNQPRDGTVTDKDGRYRFRLTPGRAEFSLCGSLSPGHGRASRVGPTVDIPAAARKITIPTIEIPRDRPQGTEPDWTWSVSAPDHRREPPASLLAITREAGEERRGRHLGIEAPLCSPVTSPR